jgi:hypothetical protein
MERRKFIQLIGVGIVTAIARLTTGGGGGDKEQPALPEPAPVKDGGYIVPDKFREYLNNAHRGKSPLSAAPLKISLLGHEIELTTEAHEDAYLVDTAMYTLGKSVHYKFNDDQELWSTPSEQMVKELEELKAESITILARYT